MKQVLKYLLPTAPLSVGIGVLAILPVVQSDNGYVAGYVFFPVVLLILLVSIILGIAGLVTLAVWNRAAPFLITAALLIPTGFFGAAFVAKKFEVGAYREQPMSSIVPSIANKVIFEKDATDNDVQKFWREVLSDPVGESGSDTRPGIQSIVRTSPENGREIVVFEFFPNATESERADVRSRIKAFAPVHSYMENVDTTPLATPITPLSDNSAPLKRIDHSIMRKSQ